YPRVSRKITDGPNDPRADCHRRPPAQGADAGTIEKDERAVADPAPLAAGVSQAGRNAQLLADPSDRIVNLAVLVRAEVEQVDAVAGLCQRQHDRVHAVADVQVRLPLPAVAEHAQDGRIVAQAFDKIEHVPVRIPLADERDEAKDEALEIEAGAIRLDEPLAR